MITENLTTLKIHKLTQEQYERELAAGNIDENALYLTPDDGNSETLEDVVYAAEESVDTFAEVINADTLGGLTANQYATQSFVANKIAEAQSSLTDLLAAGNMVLSSYQYGTELPDAGTAGRLFFKVVE